MDKAYQHRIDRICHTDHMRIRHCVVYLNGGPRNLLCLYGLVSDRLSWKSVHPVRNDLLNYCLSNSRAYKTFIDKSASIRVAFILTFSAIYCSWHIFIECWILKMSLKLTGYAFNYKKYFKNDVQYINVKGSDAPDLFHSDYRVTSHKTCKLS